MAQIYYFRVPEGQSVDSVRKAIHTALSKVHPNYSRRDILISTCKPDLVRVIIFNNKIKFTVGITKGDKIRKSKYEITMTAEGYGISDYLFTRYIIEEEDLEEKEKMYIYYYDKNCFSFGLKKGSKYRFCFKFEVSD